MYRFRRRHGTRHGTLTMQYVDASRDAAQIAVVDYARRRSDPPDVRVCRLTATYPKRRELMKVTIVDPATIDEARSTMAWSTLWREGVDD